MTAICRLGSERSTDVGLTQVVIYHLPVVQHRKYGPPHQPLGDRQEEP